MKQGLIFQIRRNYQTINQILVEYILLDRYKYLTSMGVNRCSDVLMTVNMAWATEKAWAQLWQGTFRQFLRTVRVNLIMSSRSNLLNKDKRLKQTGSQLCTQHNSADTSNTPIRSLTFNNNNTFHITIIWSRVRATFFLSTAYKVSKVY